MDKIESNIAKTPDGALNINLNEIIDETIERNEMVIV